MLPGSRDIRKEELKSDKSGGVIEKMHSGEEGSAKCM